MFGPVFPRKRSSDWALSGLFWMGQGKLGKGTRQYENRHHTPPHVRMNNELLIAGGDGFLHVRTYDKPGTYEEKNACFSSVFYLILVVYTSPVWGYPKCEICVTWSHLDVLNYSGNHGASRLVLAMSTYSVKPDMLRPGIVGMRGSMVIRLRPCMIMSTPPP